MPSPILLLLSLVSPADAVLPLPVYPECGEEDRPDLCPPDLDEEWWMIGYIPPGSRATVRPAERAMGSGNNVDKAFRVTTGRTDVVLAVGGTRLTARVENDERLTEGGPAGIRIALEAAHLFAPGEDGVRLPDALDGR